MHCNLNIPNRNAVLHVCCCCPQICHLRYNVALSSFQHSAEPTPSIVQCTMEVQTKSTGSGKGASMWVCSAGVRVWCGDIIDLPTFMGPADAVFFNACFGNLFSMRDALLRCTLLLPPGGRIIISHPLGLQWQVDLHEASPLDVPHEIPRPEEWGDMTAGLALEVEKIVDEEELYIVVLKVGRSIGRTPGIRYPVNSN